MGEGVNVKGKMGDGVDIDAKRNDSLDMKERAEKTKKDRRRDAGHANEPASSMPRNTSARVGLVGATS